MKSRHPAWTFVWQGGRFYYGFNLPAQVRVLKLNGGIITVDGTDFGWLGARVAGLTRLTLFFLFTLRFGWNDCGADRAVEGEVVDHLPIESDNYFEGEGQPVGIAAREDGVVVRQTAIDGGAIDGDRGRTRRRIGTEREVDVTLVGITGSDGSGEVWGERA